MITICGVEGRYDSVQLAAVLTKTELLTTLKAWADEKNGRYGEIGEVLGLPSSRVSEIFNSIRDTDSKRRDLSYEEGVKLVQAFQLEQSHQAQPLPASVLRLAVRHIARKLQAPAGEAQIEELGEDLRAFSEYVSNPRVRQSVEAAEGFFQALQLRRPTHEEEARQETDHESDPAASR